MNKQTLIEFEHSGHKGPRRNSGVINFDELDGEKIVSYIVFADPVKRITYNQLFDLFNQIQAVRHESNEAQAESKELTVGDSTNALSIIKPGGIDKAIAGLEKMLGPMHANLKNKKDWTPEDDSLSNKAFNLINELLGRSKKLK